MSARLSPTEAVLAAAAATTRAEMLAARLAVIDTGLGMMRGLDRSLLVAGDGTAGARLLASAPGRGRTCAARTSVLEHRLHTDLEAAARPDVDLRDLPMPGVAG